MERTLIKRNLVTVNKFCQSVGTSLYRGSTVSRKNINVFKFNSSSGLKFFILVYLKKELFFFPNHIFWGIYRIHPYLICLDFYNSVLKVVTL